MDSTNVKMEGEFIQWPPKEPDKSAAFITNSTTLLGFVVFLSLAMSKDHGKVSVVLSLLRISNLLASICLLAAFVLVHELIHGALFALFGCKPRFGMVRTKSIPYFYVNSGGARLHKNKLLVVLAAPTLVLTIAGIAVMLIAPYFLRTTLVLTLTMHLWGCVCDLRMVHLLLRLPRCADIEDLDNRIRIYANC